MAAYEEAGKSDDWYTPAHVFEALACRFDLDVAAPHDGPRYVPCDGWISQNSLIVPWSGFIWMNPPFGHQRHKRQWLSKFFSHGDGIALTPDRTSAPWWQEAAERADAIMFVAGKIKFERPDGSIGESPGTGTTLLAAGRRAASILKRAGLNGMGFVAGKAQP